MAKSKKTIIIAALVIVSIGATLYYMTKSKTFQFFGEIYSKVDTEQKVVALSFDDGPTKNTDTILAILKECNVKATFFINGDMIENHMAETKKIVSAGHELGNHSFSHQRMIFKTYNFIMDEIERTDSLIRLSGYTGPINFRPPNGKKLFVLPYYLKKSNRKTIMWDVEPEAISEIAESSDKIAEYVVDNSLSGSIILLHGMFDSRRESIKAISKIIDGLELKGFKFKTITELLEFDKTVEH